jgi:hypothetical protein
MSEQWMDIQSFFADQEILGAINDLSIAIKQKLGGIHDAERFSRATQARSVLQRFFQRLEEATAPSERETFAAIDPRFKELADSFQSARRDPANFQSILMRGGAKTAGALLETTKKQEQRELLKCLDELRRVVAHHQQTDVSAIIEDF